MLITKDTLEKDGVFLKVWSLTFGVFFSVSIAVTNILILLLLVYFFIYHNSKVKEQFQSYYFILFLSIALIFQCIGIIHDGWFITKAAKVFVLFMLALLIGNILRGEGRERWLTWGLLVGLIIGTLLSHFLRPEYPLWATYSMFYANQAAGFVLVLGLFSYILKNNWLFIVFILISVIYAVMAGERASFVVLLLSFMVMLFVLRKYKVLLACSIVLVILIPVGNIVMSSNIIENLKSTYNHMPRLDIWFHGFQVAQRDSFLGRGEQHQFGREEAMIFTNITPEGTAYLAHIFPLGAGEEVYQQVQLSYHSQPVQYLVEYGVIGCFIFIIYLCYPLLIIWQKGEHTHATTAGILMWLGFVGHSLFETSFDNQTAIIVGLMAGMTGLFWEGGEGKAFEKPRKV